MIITGWVRQGERRVEEFQPISQWTLPGASTMTTKKAKPATARTARRKAEKATKPAAESNQAAAEERASAVAKAAEAPSKRGTNKNGSSPKSTSETNGNGKTGAPKKEGLRVPQVRILQALSDEKARTKKQIVKDSGVDLAYCTEWIGSNNPDIRAKNDAKHFPSLITLGYVRAEKMDVDGKDVFVYEITSKGKKIAAKLTD
jgi:PAB1-binding protein PBP1